MFNYHICTERTTWTLMNILISVVDSATMVFDSLLCSFVWCYTRPLYRDMTVTHCVWWI